MRIESSAFVMSAAHRQTETIHRESSLRFWTGARQPAPAEKPTLSAPNVLPRIQHTPSLEKVLNEPATDIPGDPKLSLLINLVERLTGRKVQIFSQKDLHTNTPAALPDAPRDSAPAQTPAVPAYGLEYDARETRTESEQTSVSASGLIRTQDGREIKFELNLVMTREFASSSEFHLRAGNAVQDPLVLNFNGTAAQLNGTTFSFDLNTDGTNETLPTLGAGSGFLALDLNQDGIINHGGELFGPATGSGFQELSAYDADHNGWIDEADPVFEKLSVWTPATEGPGSLLSLAEAGVGALSIAPVDSPFSLKNAQNDLMGQIRSTGILLQEDGRVGTLQQIDLAV